MDRYGYIDSRLAEVPLFASLGKKQLREISSLATEVDVADGRVLTREGEHGNEFIVILDGEAEVRVNHDVVATLGSGDFFGEIALMANRPSTATVVAKTPMKLEVIHRREFQTLLRDNPEIACELLGAATDRLADLDDLDERS